MVDSFCVAFLYCFALLSLREILLRGLRALLLHKKDCANCLKRDSLVEEVWESYYWEYLADLVIVNGTLTLDEVVREKILCLLLN